MDFFNQLKKTAQEVAQRIDAAVEESKINEKLGEVTDSALEALDKNAPSLRNAAPQEETKEETK
jgi:hypothetical protein